jgi:hypothetical protein
VVGLSGIILVLVTLLIGFDPNYPGRDSVHLVALTLFILFSSAPFAAYIIVAGQIAGCAVIGVIMLGLTAWLNTAPLRSTSSTIGIAFVASVLADYALVMLVWVYVRIVRRTAAGDSQ